MRRRRDERGGAISLWVVLMVPVSAFAAVAAMAGPQRLAAESTMQEAADDLAAFAVAWRDGQNTPSGPLLAFFPECEMLAETERTELEDLHTRFDGLSPSDPPIVWQQIDNDLRGWWPLALPMVPVPTSAASSADEVGDRLNEATGHVEEWEGVCRTVLETLLRDLGHLGIDPGSMLGFYSDSLTTAGWYGECSVPGEPNRAACETASGIWTPEPCRTSQEAVVHDAVHVAVAADWQNAGWAAAQVWPHGMRVAAESMGRLSQLDNTTPLLDPCDDRLIVLDSEGRPVWAGNTPSPASRDLSQFVRRTALSG